MRILHCIPSMEGGGAERQLTYLAAQLHKLGAEVHVALVGRGANWARLQASGAKIHELRLSGSHDPRLFRQLLEILRSVNPDVVQLWLRQMEIAGGVAALAAGKPFILTERSSIKAYPRSFKWLVRRGIGRFASAIVSNSEEGDAYWRGRASQRTPRFVIANAIPLAEIMSTEPAEAHVAPRDGRFVLYAGRLDPGKNIDTLLEALRLSLSENSFDVICCGEGPLRSLVTDWIDRHGYGQRVRLLGYMPGLWGLMKRAAALVSPSLFEGSPNVVLEAMACRCPLIVSDIPAHRALVDESAAALVAPESATQFATAILSVLRDDQAARRRSDVAFARAQRFAPADIAKQYLDVYRSILARPVPAERRERI